MTCQTITTFQDISMLVGSFVIGFGVTTLAVVAIGYICVVVNDAFSGN